MMDGGFNIYWWQDLARTLAKVLLYPLLNNMWKIKKKQMIQLQIKLRLNRKQEIMLNQWLWNLTGVWNWAIRKIEIDAKNKIYHGPKDFQNLLANHSKTLDIPSHTLQGMLSQAHLAWTRCFKKLAKKPKLKGKRNKLTSVPFPDPIRFAKNKVVLPTLGRIRYHKQVIPVGKIKCGRVIKKVSGWYLSLVIDAQPNNIVHKSSNRIGIDPGFNHLLTLSTGEKIKHPRELEASQKRLAQAQRGWNRKLASRIQEKIANQRKDRNHKLSRKLVSENSEIYFSKDNIKGIAKRFGKSVASSSHGQLRLMLAYKCTTSGRKYVEVTPKNSTRMCSSCRALSGPTGLAQLSVRVWVCQKCGTSHDRDINAAINTLKFGVGTTHEVHYVKAA